MFGPRYTRASPCCCKRSAPHTSSRSSRKRAHAIPLFLPCMLGEWMGFASMSVRCGSLSFILCAFPTHLVKAAQYLSCHLPGGVHQVDFTWLLQVPLFKLSCFLLCSSVTSHWHFGTQPWSSSILNCWSERLLGSSSCPTALGQLAKPHCATRNGKPAQPSPATQAGGCRVSLQAEICLSSPWKSLCLWLGLSMGSDRWAQPVIFSRSRGESVCGIGGIGGDTAPHCLPGPCSPGHLSTGSGGTCLTGVPPTSMQWLRSGERLSSSKVSTRGLCLCHPVVALMWQHQRQHSVGQTGSEW